MHARAKWDVDMELGRGNLGGVARPQPSSVHWERTTGAARHRLPVREGRRRVTDAPGGG